MPGNVQPYTVTAVMPFALAVKFTHVREFALAENLYPDGSYQSRPMTATSRKRWSLRQRLTAAEMTALREFFEDQLGPMVPFWFYYGAETDPAWSWDETGTETQGRYSVRFAGPLSRSVGLCRADAEFDLIEIQ